MFTLALQIVFSILVIGAPLVMSSLTSELFEFNKLIFIYLSTLIVLFFWFAKMIAYRKIVFRRTILDIPILLFLLVMTISTFFSMDFTTSLFGYYGRFNGGLTSIIAYVILFYAFVSNMSAKFVRKLLLFSLLSSFITILWGLPGRFGADLSCFVFTGQFTNACWTDQFRPAERMFSTLGQPNWLGAYLAIQFFFALYFLFEKYEKSKLFTRSTILLTGYILLNWMAILFTRSRSALFAVVGGTIFFLLAYWIVQMKKHKKFFIDGRIILLGALIIFPIFVFRTGIEKVDRIITGAFIMQQVQQTVPPPPQKAVQSSALEGDGVTESFDIRKIVWQGAIDLGKQNPILGTGPETFAYAYYKVRPTAHNLTSEWDYLYNKAHNEFLNYFATTGFLGILAYVGMILFVIFMSIRYFIRTKDPFALALLMSYWTILFTNFFGFSTTTVNLFFYLIPGLVLVHFEVKEHEKKEHLLLGMKQYALLGVLAFFLLAGIVYLGRYYFADMIYAQADVASHQQDYQTSANLMQQAIQLRQEHVYEDKLSYMLANLAFLASYQKQNDVASQLIQLSRHYNEASLKQSPKNVLYWKTSAKNAYLFYEITLNPDELRDGIRALKRATELSPTDPKIQYSLALLYSLLADETNDPIDKKRYEDESIATIDKSIELKNNYRDSYVLKGQLLKKYSRKDEAKKVFEFILSHFDPNAEDVKKELTDL